MKRQTLLLNIITCITLLLAAVNGILSNLASNQIPQAVTPYLRFTWPILIVGSVAFIGFTLWQNHLSTKNESSMQMPESRSHLPLALFPPARSREELLRRVYAHWITDKLESSLDGIVPLSLLLKEQPEAVAKPVKRVQKEIKQLSTSILQIYLEASGDLLLLGEPGSGKTVLLLQLTEKLLARARQEEKEPIPVVLRLASWSEKKQSLNDWVLEEMSVMYRVPRELSQSWINDGQIALLLDGLDEVTKEHREACVGAINAYRLDERYGADVVVSSRSTVYWDMTERLDLHQAVEVQPIDEKHQLDECLSRNSEKLATVRKVFSDDPELRKMATTPLALTALRQACDGKSVKNLLTAPLEVRRHQIAMTYFQYMFKHREIASPYSQKEMRRWLVWLAEQMERYHLTTFALEQIQPTWLPNCWLRRLYLGLNWGLVFGLVAGAFIGLIVTLIDGLTSGWGNGIINGMFTLWFIELVIGLLIGPIFGVVALPHIDWERWLQPLGKLLEKFGADRDVSLWRVAPVGEAVIGLGTILLLMAVAFVMLYALLLYPAWLLIRLLTAPIFGPIPPTSIPPNTPVATWIGTLIFMAFIILYCKKAVKRLFRRLIENEETVEMWLKRPATALLCLFLSFTGSMPRNYPQFLNYTEEYALLRKVQMKSSSQRYREYTFVHPLLFEYFARLNKRQTSAKTHYLEALPLVNLYLQEKTLQARDRAMEKVSQAFGRAIELDSDNAKYYAWRGWTYLRLKKYEQALDDYNQALELDSDNAEYYSERGNVFDELEKYEEALADYDKAIELASDNAAYYARRGWTYLCLEKYEQALADYTQAIKLDSDNAAYYARRGWTYLCLEKYELALDDYRRAIKLDSSEATYYYRRGLAYYALEKYKEALADYTQAICLDPKRIDAYHARRDVYINLGRLEEASKDLEEAQRLLDEQDQLQDLEKTQKLSKQE